MSKKIPNFGILFGEAIEGNAAHKRLPDNESLKSSLNWEKNSSEEGCFKDTVLMQDRSD